MEQGPDILFKDNISLTKDPYIYHHKQISEWDFTHLDQKEVDDLITHNEKLYHELVEEFCRSNFLNRRPETVGLIVLYVPVHSHKRKLS